MSRSAGSDYPVDSKQTPVRREQRADGSPAGHKIVPFDPSALGWVRAGGLAKNVGGQAPRSRAVVINLHPTGSSSGPPNCSGRSRKCCRRSCWKIVVRAERGMKVSRFRVSITRKPLLRSTFASLLAVSSASTFSGAPASRASTAIEAAVPGVDDDRAKLPGALAYKEMRNPQRLWPQAEWKTGGARNSGDLVVASYRTAPCTGWQRICAK